MLNVFTQRIMLLSLLLCSLQSAMLHPALAELRQSVAPNYTAELVWGEEINNRYVLFYSLLQNGSWQKPLQLSHSDHDSLVPTLAAGSGGRTIAAWSVLNGAASYLEFAVLENGRIKKKPERIETGMKTNLGAVLGIDGNGVAWLVWAGNNGTPSDIFYSSFRNGRWLPPRRVHPPNAVPDILPELEIDPGGEVIVHWKSITVEGTPVYMTKNLQKPGISTFPAREMVGHAGQVPGGNDCIADFPVEAGSLDKAVLLSRCNKDGAPVQTRFFSSPLRKAEPGNR